VPPGSGTAGVGPKTAFRLNSKTAPDGNARLREHTRYTPKRRRRDQRTVRVAVGMMSWRPHTERAPH